MHDLVAEFYRWLVEASLRLCVILPLLLIVAAVSRRTPSWIVCVMLATGLVMGIVSPQLPEALRITLPVLEVTRAFELGLPTGLAGADVADRCRRPEACREPDRKPCLGSRPASGRRARSSSCCGAAGST